MVMLLEGHRFCDAESIAKCHPGAVVHREVGTLDLGT